MKIAVSLSLIGLGLGLSFGATAQDLRPTAEKLVACQTLDNPVERLACFEREVKVLDALLTARVPAPAVAQAPVLAPQATPAPVASVPAPSVPAAPVSPPSTAVASASATVPVPTPAEPEADERGSLLPSWMPKPFSGDDEPKGKEPRVFETTITRIQRNNLGRHFFTTADGTVWRQLEPGDIRTPDSLPASGVFRRGSFGSVRLELDDNGRSYKVTPAD
ncbi:MAG: hypothetical protein AAGF20_02575 [Pseudomonadota bacterium]